MLAVKEIIAAFSARYKEEPECVVRAPGRVNLIGEHTDYNEGFVLPMAIDRATYVAANRRVDRLVRTFSQQFAAEDRFSLETIERSETRPWANYIRGVALAFQARDLPLFGANLLIDSDIPPGSGLSSSAALEVAVGYAFQLINHLSLLGEELALLAHGAENSFVGMRCGIMDQFIAALGEAGHALLIDCRDLSYRSVPMPDGVSVVVCDSGVRQDGMAVAAYNERRDSCQQIVKLLRPAISSHVTALRDISMVDLQRHASLLSPTLLARARHVVSENERVLATAEALEAGDLKRCGTLLYDSHASLRDDYQVSTPELDLLVELAHRQPGCYGARMTGSGFGGSIVCLVTTSNIETFRLSMTSAYRRESGRETAITVCRAIDGVRRAGSS